LKEVHPHSREDLIGTRRKKRISRPQV